MNIKDSFPYSIFVYRQKAEDAENPLEAKLILRLYQDDVNESYANVDYQKALAISVEQAEYRPAKPEEGVFYVQTNWKKHELIHANELLDRFNNLYVDPDGEPHYKKAMPPMSFVPSSPYYKIDTRKAAFTVITPHEIGEEVLRLSEELSMMIGSYVQLNTMTARFSLEDRIKHLLTERDLEVAKFHRWRKAKLDLLRKLYSMRFTVGEISQILELGEDEILAKAKELGLG